MEKRKIMLIDDEDDFRMIVRVVLEKIGGYEVLALPGAKHILSKVKKFHPDLILLDIVMPEIGGFEACDILKGDSDSKNIPIIILSALDKEADKKKAYDLGVTDYMTKPIEKKDLIDRIEKGLENSI